VEVAGVVVLMAMIVVEEEAEPGQERSRY
jgi:hypothetical protein